MNTLAQISSDAASWLAEHAHPELRIAAIQLEEESHTTASVSVQLGASAPAAAILAAWSEHLGIPAVVRRSATERFLKGTITTRTRGGYSLELWTHFSAPEWVDLQAVTGLRFTGEPVELDAMTLRAAMNPSKDIVGAGGLS